MARTASCPASSASRASTTLLAACRASGSAAGRPPPAPVWSDAAFVRPAASSESLSSSPSTRMTVSWPSRSSTPYSVGVPFLVCQKTFGRALSFSATARPPSQYVKTMVARYSFV